MVARFRYEVAPHIAGYFKWKAGKRDGAKNVSLHPKAVMLTHIVGVRWKPRIYMDSFL